MEIGRKEKGSNAWVGGPKSLYEMGGSQCLVCKVAWWVDVLCGVMQRRTSHTLRFERGGWLMGDGDVHSAVAKSQRDTLGRTGTVGPKAARDHKCVQYKGSAQGQ